MSEADRSEIEIEVLEDRAEKVSPKGGFLKLQRLIVRNRYVDGSTSEPYPCDIVSRPGTDAVTVAMFQRRTDGTILVGLRELARVPVLLRRTKKDLIFPDDPPYGPLLETVAGVLEKEDGQHPLRVALRRRAIVECLEEAGVHVAESAILDLGGASFPTPGVADELVYFLAAEVDLSQVQPPDGDGSIMEEYGGLVILPLDEAIARCRSGAIPDMKTEIALTRLRDRLSASR